MFDWLRKLVAGAKNRTISQGYDLDLTYITPNIIAMAYPASGFQQIYRNCKDQVAQFLNQRHKGNYYIINVSNRTYEADMFQNKIKLYQWNDHQAPTLAILFQLCDFASNFFQRRISEKLERSQKVIVVHCNHGKGRTGTAIMALLLFFNLCSSVDQSLQFYNKKRFSKENYAVDRPCQLRYLQFFKDVLSNPEQYHSIHAFKLQNILQQGLNSQYYLRITYVTTNEEKYSSISLNDYKMNEPKALLGDIFMEVYSKGVLCNTLVTKINIHLEWLKKVEANIYQFQVKGEELRMQNCHHDNFKMTFEFGLYCQCHIQKMKKQGCECLKDRNVQINNWNQIHAIIKKNKLNYSTSLIANQSEDKLEK